MNKIPELDELLQLEKLNLPNVEFRTIETIFNRGIQYPVKAIVIGSHDKTLPTLGLFGGVHGLERVGSQIIISYLRSLFYQLLWDKNLNESLKNYRIIAIPIVNPGGMVNLTRCNPNNVDLMRNAPVEAIGQCIPLVSGHRTSEYLPWYRGKKDILEKETEALIRFVNDEMFQAKVSLPLDIHSGFGIRDQIWHPYAKTKSDFPLISEALKLKCLLDKTYPHHVYKFEAQSVNYITNGDLWDYLFDSHYKEHVHQGSIFLPLTLELGSWAWVRKNPLQFFSKTGLFHPIKKHRHARTMRRHVMLLDFLGRAIQNHRSWPTCS